MIIINKSGYLKYQDLKFRCALGRAGIGKKSREGDQITPNGAYKIIKIYYRKDRIKKITSKFKLVEIKKNMGWCDDPKSKKYNQLIKLPNEYNHEKLYRKDNVYDLILVLNYNTRPIIKNKGSRSSGLQKELLFDVCLSRCIMAHCMVKSCILWQC